MGVRHVLVLGAMGYDGFAGDMWVGGGAWWAGCGTLWVVVGVRVCRVCLLCGGRWLAGVVWLVTCAGRWVAGGWLRMGLVVGLRLVGALWLCVLGGVWAVGSVDGGLRRGVNAWMTGEFLLACCGWWVACGWVGAVSCGCV